MVNAKLANVCREGTVSEVYPERHSCRVVFEDKGNMVSAELPILTLFAYKNKSYSLPDVGERVVVLQASNDNTSGSGYVIGSLYTSETPPPANNQEVTRLEYTDKMFVEYDREKHLFKLQFNDETSITYDGESNELAINCKGDIKINTARTLEVKAEDEITIGTNKRMEVTAKDEINVDAKEDINMTGRNIRLN